MQKGWVRLHRSVEDWEFYFSEPFTKAQAWIDMFLIANHSEAPVSLSIRGNIVTIKRGQIGWSEEALAKRWQWSRGRVRRFLGMLETRQQIVQQKTAVISVITILRYNEYQQNGTTDGTADGHQTVQQTDTNKNEKNEKNEKMKEEMRGGTPAQIAREFFESQEVRLKTIQALSEKGMNEVNAKTEVEKFARYWTELNKSGTKQRWELQQTFDVTRRLWTWLERSSNFTSRKKGGITIIS